MASGDHLDAIVLDTEGWSVSPLEIESVYSTYFSDLSRFPTGSTVFDCALAMRNIAHEWHAEPPMPL
jgi:hypothetical protein